MTQTLFMVMLINTAHYFFLIVLLAENGATDPAETNLLSTHGGANVFLRNTALCPPGMLLEIHVI